MQLSCWGMGRQAYGLALAGAMLLLTTPSMAFKGIRQIPYPQAEQVTRTAAEAVIVRSGSESCLRGKLTNALLDITMSCSPFSLFWLLSNRRIMNCSENGVAIKYVLIKICFFQI